MAFSAILTDRTYNLNTGKVGWNSSLDKLRSYPSVVKADFWERCSSAGDWSGYVIQKIKDTFYLIFFNQENNYPRYGFTVYTGEVRASWTNPEFIKDDDVIFEIIQNCLEN